jgi:hypothetical protein
MVERNPYEERSVYIQEHAWSEGFEHLAVCVAQLTSDGRFLTVNEQMCGVIGQPRRDLLEKSLNELFFARRVMA